MTDKEYLECMIAKEQETHDAGRWSSGISLGLEQAKRMLANIEKLNEIDDMTKFGTRQLQDHNGEVYVVVTVEDLREELDR